MHGEEFAGAKHEKKSAAPTFGVSLTWWMVLLLPSQFKDHANSSSTSAADSILGFRTDAWKGCANNCVFYHNPADYIALCENILKSKNL